jgi:basic amino acid/polyamine antiporter, APA family
MNQERHAAQPPARLERVLGWRGALGLGLGSMLGTGVFVSLALATGIAGPWALPALTVAALVALTNALSSARLAAAHPVSGGTYEYGYAFVHPWAGFAAGWLFLCAKSASAATAALGLSGYLLHALGRVDSQLHVLVAFSSVVAMTGLARQGMHRSNRANAAIVTITLSTLSLFVISSISEITIERFWMNLVQPLTTLDTAPSGAFAEATAILFVAYTGYGRIATLGEEVKDPARTIPVAILATVAVTFLVYAAVCGTSIAALGSATFASTLEHGGAPLERTAQLLNLSLTAKIVATGAITAMIGVLLNLILGLSRVLMAMARRTDMPRCFSEIDARGGPGLATLAVGMMVGSLTLIGDMKTTWSLSAFAVLLYYAITHVAALRLRAKDRRYPKLIALCGLIACLTLAFSVDITIWLAGLTTLALGFAGRVLVAHSQKPDTKTG